MESRKTRTRGARKRLTRKRTRLRRLKDLLVFSGGCYFLFHPMAEAANAIGAIGDAQSAGERLRGEAKRIVERHQNLQYIEELEKAIVSLEKNLDELEISRQESDQNLEDAYTWVREAMEDQLHAEVVTRVAEDALRSLPSEMELREAVRIKEANRTKALALYEAAEAAYSAAESADNYADSGGIALPPTVSETDLERVAARALDEVQYDENRIEEAETKVATYLQRAYGVADDSSQANSGSSNAHIERLSSHLDTASQALDSADGELEEAEERLQDWQDAKENLTQANADEKEERAAYAEAQVNLRSASEYWNSVREDTAETETDLKELRMELLEVQGLLSPLQNYKGSDTKMRYFSWKDAAGNKGSQLHTTYSYSQQEGDLVYGLETGIVRSNNRAYSDGSERGLTDTTLRAAKINSNEINTVTYGLDVNVPTGKSKMASNAIVLDDLADIGRFGEGWNFTPRLRVDHKIGEEDTWSYEMDLSLKGSYAYDKNFPGTTVQPGNELGNSLEWMHAGQNWQMLIGASHSIYGRTKEGETEYREGGYTDLEMYYNRVLTPNQDLLGYYRYTVGRNSNYYSGIDWQSLDGTLRTQYYGIEWKYKIAPGQSLRVMGNAMLAGGQIYHPLTDQQVDGRKRYGLLIGYDRDIDEQSNFSVDLERFYMKDGNVSSYHGWNVFLTYQKSF